MPLRPWQSRHAYRRKVAELDPRTRILIVCEGEKTEPNYFRSFPVDKDVVEIHIEGAGDNTDSLVGRAIQMVDSSVKQKRPYNQAWCVFDKDSFSTQNFNRAIQLARANKIQVAYTNEAFELWYLLHFAFHDTAISRARYRGLLTDRLNEEYKKNDPNMYTKLLVMQSAAIRNACTLQARYARKRPAEDNPSTTVHELVRVLNGLAPEE